MKLPLKRMLTLCLLLFSFSIFAQSNPTSDTSGQITTILQYNSTGVPLVATFFLDDDNAACNSKYALYMDNQDSEWLFNHAMTAKSTGKEVTFTYYQDVLFCMLTAVSF